MLYADKLNDSRWIEKRQQVLRRDNYCCRSCGASNVTLNVHHTYYEKDKEPWEYPNKSLVTYCQTCHNTFHILWEDLYQDLRFHVENSKLHVRQLSLICILSEHYGGFDTRLRNFLENEMSDYLQSKK